MQEFYLRDYDVNLKFPDGMGEKRIKGIIERDYPEPDEKLVARFENPDTPASSLSKADHERYLQARPDMTAGRFAGMAADAFTSTAGRLLTNLPEFLKTFANPLEMGVSARTLAEGFARGTYDTETMGRMAEGYLMSKVEGFGGRTDDEKENQYRRFLKVKELQNVRSKIDQGDKSAWNEYMEYAGANGAKIDPEKFNRGAAEFLGEFADPSLLIPGSKVGTAIAKTTGRVTGGAVSAAGDMMSAGGRRLSDMRSTATDAVGNLASKVDEASGGLGRYAVPTGVGTAIGVGALDLGTAGMGTLAVAGIPAAMEVAGGLLRNFGDAMKVNPTRSGGLARMALNSPDTAAGYLAGKLQFLDTPVNYAGRAASGAVTGVGVGAGIGLATGGVEGVAQGIGSGGAMGAFGGTMGRFKEGATGAAKRAAQDSDLAKWLGDKSDEDRASLGRYKNRDDQIRAMDLEQVILGSTSEAEPIIRYGTDKTVIGQDAQGKDITLKGGGGAYTQEGGRPVIHLNTNSDLRTLAHETFHAIARIDGFEVMVQRIKDQVGKLYKDQEIDTLINDYEKSGKLLVTDDTPGKSDRDKKFNSILEEIGAEYFANYIKGKDSNYLFKGNPIREAIRGITDRFVAGKLDRVHDTFKSDIFDTPIKQSKALNRSIDDLVRARRRSKRNINLSVDTPVRVYSDFDLKDDAIFQELVDMGAARVTATGKREMIKSKTQVKKIEAERTRTMAKVLDSVDDTGGLIRDERGNYSGLRFSKKQIDALLASDAITGTLRKALEKIKEMPDDSGLMNVLYAAATAKTKKGLTRYRNLPLSNRDAILYNFIISPDQGTMRVKIVDKTLLDQRVAKEFASPETQKEFSNIEEMQRDLLTYLDALSSGQTPTAEVLGSAKKRDILGKVLRVRNQKGNPLVPEGTKFNEGEKDFPWRDFRLDRIVQMTARETKVNFSEDAYNRAGINFSPKVSDDPLRVGTAKLGTKAKPKDTPQDSNISGTLVSDVALRDHMSKMDYDHVPDRIKGIEDPHQKREAYIDWMVENLLALHDAFPADLREMATQWYDGAYLIANTLAKKYEYQPQQVAGVAAVLSPQKDWFMNVAQAEQVIDIWVNHKDLRLDKKWLRDEVEYIIDAAEAPVKQKRKVKKTDTPLAKTRKRNYNKRLDDQAKSDRREVLERIYGKTVSELDTDPKLQGWAIRVLAQVIHGREYRVVSPDGKPMQISVKDDGTPQKNGWGSVKEINKAVSILKDGSLENISEQLGDKHKVRNFFNNIISPNSPFGDATIDTHAVAAAHLQPYGASATPVSHNFGSGVSRVNSPGVSGTYHIYLDAYKRAAEKRGLLPRQMQSITWEAVRLLYPSETRKGKKGIEKATDTWKSNTDEQARKTIVGGELPPPAWARSRDGGKPEGVPGGIPEDGATQDAGRGLLFRGGRHVYPGRVKRRGKAKQDPGPSLPAGIFSIDPAKSGRQFHRSIIKTAKDHPLGAAVEVKDLDFYKDTDTALFLSKDKKAGVAVTKDGDLVSVFKHPKSKADIVPLLEEAASVATTLDAFDVGGFLPNLYAKQGFKPIARVPWNDEYAPPGWPYDKAGKPDVVLMVRDPEGVLSDGFTDYNQSRDSVPMYDDYDVAMAKQKEAKAKVVKAGLGPEVRFSPGSKQSESMPAFNVKNEAGSPFADMIAEGVKTIETRPRPTLNSIAGSRVKLIRTTGEGSGEVIGEVTVGEPKFYATKEEFDADFDKHLVKDDSEFAFGGQGKYGYPMLEPVKYQEPYSVDSVRDRPKGRVTTRDMPGPRFSPERMESLPSGEGPVLPKVEPPILQGPSANVVSLAKVKAEISKEKSPKVVDNTEIQEDIPVGLRLDIPTYERTIKAGQPVFPVAVHEKWKGKQAGKAGKVIGYTNIAAVKNPVFTVNEKAAESIKGGKAKSTIATVEGLYSKTREIPEDIDTWTQVGMNPRRHSYFYDRETGQPVIGGDVAISSGNTVFVKNPIYDSPGSFRFSPQRELNKRGGAIYTNERGDRAVQTSSRAGVRVYSTQGKRIGPVFRSIEKAERHLAKMGK